MSNPVTGSSLRTGEICRRTLIPNRTPDKKSAGYKYAEDSDDLALLDERWEAYFSSHSGERDYICQLMTDVIHGHGERLVSGVDNGLVENLARLLRLYVTVRETQDENSEYGRKLESRFKLGLPDPTNYETGMKLLDLLKSVVYCRQDHFATFPAPVDGFPNPCPPQSASNRSIIPPCLASAICLLIFQVSGQWIWCTWSEHLSRGPPSPPFRLPPDDRDFVHHQFLLLKALCGYLHKSGKRETDQQKHNDQLQAKLEIDEKPRNGWGKDNTENNLSLQHFLSLVNSYEYTEKHKQVQGLWSLIAKAIAPEEVAELDN